MKTKTWIYCSFFWTTVVRYKARWFYPVASKCCEICHVFFFLSSFLYPPFFLLSFVFIFSFLSFFHPLFCLEPLKVLKQTKKKPFLKKYILTWFIFSLWIFTFSSLICFITSHRGKLSWFLKKLLCFYYLCYYYLCYISKNSTSYLEVSGEQIVLWLI